MSKERALKFSGLTLQQSSSLAAAPSVALTSLTTAKRPSMKTVAANAAAVMPVATSSLQVLASSLCSFLHIVDSYGDSEIESIWLVSLHVRSVPGNISSNMMGKNVIR